MTSPDKTKSQLIDSMRMSKDTAANNPAPKKSNAKAAPPSKKVQKKSVSAAGIAPAASAEGGTPAKSRPAAAKSLGRAVDPYQGRRRGTDDPYQGRRRLAADPYQGSRLVWPD